MQVTYDGADAEFIGMARTEHGICAVIRLTGASLLKIVHPSRCGINNWCHYCGSIEEPRDGLWEHQDWPRCPDCHGC